MKIFNMHARAQNTMLISILAALLTLVSSAADLNVNDFGAKGDDAATDTLAIQQAIDRAAEKGGGRVILEGGTFISGTIYLRSAVELHIRKDAVLKGSPEREHYCKPEDFKQNFASPPEIDNTSGGHLIVAHDCENISISGPGTIDGNSSAFLLDPSGKQYRNWKKGIPFRPGQMIYIVDCRNVNITHLKMRNSPYWTCHILNCTNVRVADCSVRTERKRYRTWNGDGIDIDRCQDTVVENCDIDTEDDCVTLRASCAKLLETPLECRNVTVRNCSLSSACNAVRVGVGEGTIHECYLSELDIKNTTVAVNIISSYSASSRGTDIFNISFSDIKSDSSQFLNLRYGRGEGHAPNAVIKNILFKNIKAQVKKDNSVAAEKSRPFKNIAFENCSFSLKRQPEKPKL